MFEKVYEFELGNSSAISGYNFVLGFFLVLFIIGLVTFFYKKTLYLNGKVQYRACHQIALFFTLLSGVVFLGGVIFLKTPQYEEDLYSKFTNKEYSIAEGTVKVLYEQAYHGHTPGDSIVVDEQLFIVDHFNSSFGYDIPIAQGGVLTEGKYVKIYHIDNDIVQIDVKK